MKERGAFPFGGILTSAHFAYHLHEEVGTFPGENGMFLLIENNNDITSLVVWFLWIQSRDYHMIIKLPVCITCGIAFGHAVECEKFCRGNTTRMVCVRVCVCVCVCVCGGGGSLLTIGEYSTT